MIPDWVTKYDLANYQSSAGIALRLVLTEFRKLKANHTDLIGRFNETEGLLNSALAGHGQEKYEKMAGIFDKNRPVITRAKELQQEYKHV